jgi:hypothetical protein
LPSPHPDNANATLDIIAARPNGKKWAGIMMLRTGLTVYHIAKAWKMHDSAERRRAIRMQLSGRLTASTLLWRK